VDSDRRLLHRVLQNLLSNAIRYTNEGKVLMGVRRARGQIVIQVADTGIGIPRGKERLIFEEFQRFAGPGTEQGSGLGLSIVERVTRLLDHPVSVKSELGRGTIFSVHVPRGRLNASERPALPSALRAFPGLERQVVLCIDNDANVRDGMKTLLDGWGCRPIVVATLADAFAALACERLRPELLVVDFHLNDIVDGLGCIDRLRTQGFAGVPAILITADRSDSIRARALANDLPILNKPLKPAALRALALRLLAARSAAE
jgi:CheY-like chemotaxis protein